MCCYVCSGNLGGAAFQLASGLFCYTSALLDTHRHARTQSLAVIARRRLSSDTPDQTPPAVDKRGSIQQNARSRVSHQQATPALKGQVIHAFMLILQALMGLAN